MQRYNENYLNSILLALISVPKLGTLAIGIGIGINVGTVKTVLHTTILTIFIGIE